MQTKKQWQLIAQLGGGYQVVNREALKLLLDVLQGKVSLPVEG